MATGHLEITGEIDLAQFWPTRQSDADTVHVTLVPPAGAFRFRASPGHPVITTKAFEHAGTFQRQPDGTKKFNPLIHQGHITIRLQGVDAPELHFQPPLKGTEDFRQYLGETCTTELAQRLRRGGGPTVSCRVVTAVDHPNDTIDAYGRFVGDILISEGGAEVNVNDWLLEAGWAFPAFYDSMSAAEITRMMAAAKPAEQQKLGIWKFYTSTIGPLDWNLVFRRNGPPLPEKDHGPVIFPKLFRRLCNYGVKVKTQHLKGTYSSFLAGLKPQDYCHQTADFLKTGSAKATQKRLSQFVTAQNKFLAEPGGLVYSEHPGTIVDAQNKPIKSW